MAAVGANASIAQAQAAAIVVGHGATVIIATGTGAAQAPALALAAMAAAQAATALGVARQPNVAAAPTVVRAHATVVISETSSTTGAVTDTHEGKAGVTGKTLAGVVS